MAHYTIKIEIMTNKNSTLKYIITILVFFFFVQNISAITFIKDGISYSTTGKNTVIVIRGGNYTGDITIPSDVNDFSAINYVVKSIGDSAFYGCSTLTGVTFPTTITSIGRSAFECCGSLNSINIPSSVTSIGSSAFGYCFRLEKLTIPSSVTTIGTSAFEGCISLVDVFIPLSVISLGNSAFKGCIDSINVDVNNQNYSSLDGVLYNKTKTRLMQCPTSKSGDFELPLSVNSIGDDAFWYCKNLTKISIPSINSIGNGAFAFCTNLSTITIPTSASIIPVNSFLGCSALNNVNISSSVKSLGAGAFWNCNNLKEIYLNNILPAIMQDTTTVYNINKSTCRLYVPIGGTKYCKTLVGWNKFVNIVEISPNAIESTKTTALGISYNSETQSLQISGNETDASISIYNINGEKIFNRSLFGNELISINSFAKGVYIVNIIGNGMKIVKKIIL